MATPVTTTTINKTVNVTVGTLTRSFIIHVPAGTLPDAGVLLLLHGGGGVASNFQTDVNMDVLANQYKFVTIYPNAVDGNWTDGRTSTQDGPDDIAFIKKAISWSKNNYQTSNVKVFATGISNGGIFCHWLVNMAPTVVLGIAPVAANIPANYIANCINSKPIIMFNGTADNLMLFNGGIPTVVPDATDAMSSSYASIAKYAANAKAVTFTDTPLPNLSNDGTSVSVREYTGGVVTPITLYVITNGGHTWPDGTGTPPPVAGKITRDINANKIMTTMFKKYGLYI